MESWIDAQAKKAAGADMSRRTMLKRAGVVGAGVWAVPVLQSVTAPAYATTGGTGTCGNPGQTCGQGCSGGLCQQGATCRSDSDCATGSGYYCGPTQIDGKRYCSGGANASKGTCPSTNTVRYCYTGACQNSNFCGKGGTGAYCRSGADCTSTTCVGAGGLTNNGFGTCT